MDLWIRSQDKELLVKVKEIELGEYDDYYCLVVNNLQNIGNYKTKERALEIIDEIQKLLTPVISYTPYVKEDIKPEYTYKHFVSEGGKTEIIQMETYVYEMPEE